MRRRNPVPLLVVMLVLLAAAIAVETTLLFGAYRAEAEKSQANESAAVEGADLADQVIAACERDDPIGQSVREAGVCKSAEDTKETVVDTLDPSTPTPTPSTKPTGPSQSQVLTAVSLLLPPAVRDSVAAQLGGELDALCAIRNGCIGLPGTNGLDAPPVTDSRLLSLIQPLIPAPLPGAPGAPGAPGLNGRGIASATCSSLVTFDLTFVFDDGTTSTITCAAGDPDPPVVPPTDPPVEVLP